MLIGRFATIPLTNSLGEVGILEFELRIPTERINAHASRKDYIINEIAQTLAGLCARHGTPKEVWDFSPSEAIRKATLLPESIPFR